MNIQEIIQKAKILPTQDQIHLASQLLQWIEQKNALLNQTVNDYEFDERLKNSIVYEGDIVSPLDENWDVEQ